MIDQKYTLPNVTLNPIQQAAVTAILNGQNFSIIGAAGTGKTTCTQYGIISLINSGALPYGSMSHKHLPTHGYGFVVTSLTKIAVANLRKKLPTDLQSNCINIHKLLEFVPTEWQEDGPNGKEITKKGFQPARNKFNPLPKHIKYFFFEEMSMLQKSTLWDPLMDAIHPDVDPVFIGLGDLNQLPPPFGESVFPYFLLSHPITALTEVYRQALDSKIINLAYQILSGVPREIPEVLDALKTSPEGKVSIRTWGGRTLTPTAACGAIGTILIRAMEEGKYDPWEDMILIPFNKSFGTIDLNKHIASALAKKYATEDDPVYEVRAGFEKHYFRVGDRVLADKEEAYVVSIEDNLAYRGAMTAAPSRTLNYFGYDPDAKEISEEEFNAYLEKHQEEEDNRVHSASHIIKVRKTNSEQEVIYRSAADINKLLLGYALTVHKAQGSEWRRVFIFLHKEHNKMLTRELLYTAVTRAREELLVWGTEETFIRGITAQTMKGDTIQDKLEWFKDNLLNNGRSLSLYVSPDEE